MYPIVPANMTEIAEKIAYLEEKGKEVSEEEVIRQAVLDNGQQMLDGALEGPYWKLAWQDGDSKLAVFDIMNKEVGAIASPSGSFIDDFKQNTPNFVRFLADHIQTIVDND
ncbi:hypothetical protein [Enterococcus sp. AD013-P3]|uniref:hypothetical protein n=1 Tax=Enterococcus sp. AD013-P3 TaxID=3411036 RepID=UPI003B958E65